MRCNTIWLMICIGVILSCFSEQAVADKNEQRIKGIKTPRSMQKAIENLRDDNHRWREIRWNRCLLNGLGQSREKEKPVLLWVFLHNPNDERC